MGNCARPFVAFRTWNHPSSNRIAFNITNSGPRVGFIEHTGKRPRLPKVSALAVLLVKFRGINSMTTLKGLGDRIGPSRLSNNVDVIGHEAIGGNRESVALGVGSQ